MHVSEAFRLNHSKRARAARWLRGRGIEIGALHNPLTVPESAEVRYVDRVSEAQLRVQYPELAGESLVPVAIIGNAEDLSGLGDASQDFVIANHLIEHLEDPIRGLREMVRVLRMGGVLYVALPDPRATFDRDRPITPIDHVIGEFRTGTTASRRAHYTEFVELAAPHIAHMREPHPEGEQARVAELMARDYSIHFHVWRPDSFLEVLVTARREAGIDLELVEFIPCAAVDDDEYIFVLIKGIGASPPGTSDTEDVLLREEIAALRRHVASLETSHSWRMTAPLRRVTHAARRLTRRFGAHA